MSGLEEIIRNVLKNIKPSILESEKIRRLSDKLISTIKELSSGHSGILDVRVEGSAAKGTWIRGREEIDIFIQFSKDIPKEELERIIIDIGTSAVKKFNGKPMLRYAEHPYVESTIDNVRINIVACYKVEPGNWLSPVDRTPYHTEYVRSKLTEQLADEIRLMKSFMIGCDLYGAEIRVGGFSGYLVELLTIYYGGFLNTIKAAASWRPPIFIDIESYYPNRREALEKFGRPPILVVDPVDRMRNVAAAVTETKLSEFILASKIFLENPKESFFYMPGRAERTRTVTEIKRAIKSRNILLLKFRVQEKSPDVLWGEIKHTLNGIKRAMEHEGFKIIRCDAFIENRTCFMVFDMLSPSLTTLYLHIGPPIHLPNAIDFIRKHVKASDTVAGPWVYGNRLYVLKRRLKIFAKDILRARIMKGDVSISNGIAEGVRKATIYTSRDDIIALASRYDGLRNFLYSFLEARPSYLKL